MKDAHQTRTKHHQKDNQRHIQRPEDMPQDTETPVEREHLIMPVGIREDFANEATLKRKVEEWELNIQK